MTIVLQVNKFYAPVAGGVERVVQDIAEGLADDFDMRVLVCSHRGRFMRDGSVVRAAAPAVAFSMPLSVQFYPLFRRHAREADIVHFHHPFPLGEIAGLLDGCAGKAVVVSYHSDIVRQRWAMPIYGPVLRALLRRADRIIVSSERLRDHSEYLSGFRNKCAVLPFGIRFDESAETFPLPARDFVLFVGRLVPYKGCEYLIRAMARVNVPLVVVGDGPLRRPLEALARAEGVAARVHFLGRISTARIRHCYSRCGLFVLPSVMNNEAFGIVQLEAMVFGKPVINTDLPTGVPEVSRHDESGLTVPPRNPVALAEAITTILTDPQRRERYGRNALARARELSMERFLDGMRRVYGEVLKER